MRVAARARPAVRRTGERHRARRRRHAGRRPGGHRHHAAQPRARGRRRRAVRVGRAGRAQPRPHPGGRAPRPALRARPVVAAGVHHRRQRRHQRRRPALPGLGRHRHPRARGRGGARRRLGRACSAASSPTSPATTCAAASSAARARWASPPGSRCGSRPTRRWCARCSSTSRRSRTPRPTVSGIIAAGIVPAALEMMDAEITRAVEDYVGAGYPRDAAAVLLVEVDGLAGGVADAGRGGRARRPRARRPHGAGRGRRGRAGAAVEGAQVGVRRDRPHRARLLPARRGRAAHASWSTCCARSTRSPPSSGSR